MGYFCPGAKLVGVCSRLWSLVVGLSLTWGRLSWCNVYSAVCGYGMFCTVFTFCCYTISTTYDSEPTVPIPRDTPLSDIPREARLIVPIPGSSPGLQIEQRQRQVPARGCLGFPRSSQTPSHFRGIGIEDGIYLSINISREIAKQNPHLFPRCHGQHVLRPTNAPRHTQQRRNRAMSSSRLVSPGPKPFLQPARKKSPPADPRPRCPVLLGPHACCYHCF